MTGDADSCKAMHSFDRRVFARFEVVHDSKTRSVDWHDASSIGAASVVQIFAGFVCQPIKPACGNIVLELAIPNARIEMSIPFANSANLFQRTADPTSSSKLCVPFPILSAPAGRY